MMPRRCTTPHRSSEIHFFVYISISYIYLPEIDCRSQYSQSSSTNLRSKFKIPRDTDTTSALDISVKLAC